MNAASPSRSELLRQIANDVPAPGDGYVLVAVDGVDGSGKTSFAEELAAELGLVGRPVVLIHADAFLNLRSVRHRRGRDSPLGFWLDSYDYEALRRFALQPFRPGGDGRYRTAATDPRKDEYVSSELQQARPGSVVIVEGLFLHRDELAQVWDFSVYLDVPFEVTAKRMAERDGTPADPAHPRLRRYVEGQRIYFDSCAPWLRASRVVDNRDVTRPFLVDSVRNGASPPLTNGH
ncbi:AAA family ATPase [Lysobacter korlensis]|uniref:AAA family ATPase n=1 Tax=Lysobacter korlensis TaxID=553636 RepID=A0ABV6S105_9GAMM